jgi:hypothetical protein
MSKKIILKGRLEKSFSKIFIKGIVLFFGIFLMFSLVSAASDYYIDSSLGNLFLVNGTTGNGLFNYNLTAGYLFGDGSGLTNIDVSAIDLSDYVPYTGATSNLVLGDNNFSVGGSDLFVDNVGGNVGIGTGSPVAKLNVISTDGLKSQIGHSAIVSGSAPTTFNSAFYLQLGQGEYTLNSYRLIGFGQRLISAVNPPAYIGYQETEVGSNTMGELVFGTRPTSTDVQATERMRITTGGNVGIGTTSPSSLFTTNTVAGTNEINLSGIVYVNSTSGRVGIGTGSPSAKIHINGSWTDGDDLLRFEMEGSRNWVFEQEGTGSSSKLSLVSEQDKEFNLDVRALNLRYYNGTGGLKLYPVERGGELRTSSSNDYLLALKNTGSGSYDLTVDGSVGIGTTTPQNKLNVVGDGNFTGNIYSNGEQVLTTSDSAVEVDPFWTGNYSAYNSTWTTTDAEIWNVAGNGTLMFASDWNSTNTSYVPYTGSSANVELGGYDFSVNTSDLFVDVSSGNVGIGTTTPDNILEVSKSDSLTTLNDSLSSVIKISNTGTTGYSGIKFAVGSGAYTNSFIGSKITNTSGYGWSDLVFATKQDTGQFDAPIEAMRIVGGTGYVGIGTTSPVTKLHLDGGTTNNPNIKLTSTASGSTATDGFQIGPVAANNVNVELYNYENGYLRFGTNNDYVSTFHASGGFSFGDGYITNDPGENNMIIEGNVGIGTTTPQNTLNVIGDVNVTDTDVAMFFENGAFVIEG